MKLPRRPTSNVIVNELQSQRNAMITPQEAANVQLAKYGAVQAGLEAAGRVFTEVADVRRKTQQAKDEISYQTNENNLDVAYTNLKNDPNLKKPVQDDGTSTADYFQRESDALLATYKKGLDDIVDPEAKKRAEQLLSNREAKMRAEMSGDAGVIESRAAEASFITSMNEAMDAGNTDGGRALLASAYSNGLVDAKGRQRWSDALDKNDDITQSQSLVDEINEAYSISEKDGNQALSELIKNKDIDQQVRDMAIDGAEEKRVEWGKAREEETKRDEVQNVIQFGDDSARASAGLMSYEQIDSAYESGRYGDGVGAASRRNQLFAKVTSAMGKKETELDIRRTYENGQFMLDDKKHRDALSEYEQSVTADMDGNERTETIGDISRTLGTVSTHTANTLNLSSKSTDALAANLKLYRELTSDKTTMPTLHLTGEASSALEDASTLVDAGVSPTEAAEIAYANGHPTELVKQERSETWSNVTVESANEAHTELLDSDYYEEPGFGDVDDPPPLMEMEYGAIYKAVYMQSGNEQAAKNVADRAIKSTWVMTNFNSADKDEYTIEKHGLPGDVHGIRNGVIREFEGERFKTRSADGTYKSTQIDPEKITFESTEGDGERKWGVLHDGVPLVRISDNGIEVATFVMDESRLSEYKEKTSTHEATEARLSDINAEIKRRETLTRDNPYGIVKPGITSNITKRIKSLENERTRLESELPNMEIHF